VSSAIDDGGPAFPQRVHYIGEKGDPSVEWGSPGMSLRDWFAGQALTGLCANGEVVPECVTTDSGAPNPKSLNIAITAYFVADAMLLARNTTVKP
jgi:hypothetical protein